MGTLIALAAARTAKSGFDLNSLGVAACPRPLIAYTSREAHSSIGKAFALLGLGTQALRLVPVDDDLRMRTDLLTAMIAEDRSAGLAPFAVIASAGTVNTGAIDPLAAIADLCRINQLWLHVDGAFGGLAIAVPQFQPELQAIAMADSISFDFHKWIHVPYDAGGVLVRDETAHRSAFASRPHYLAGQAEGLAGGEPWYCDDGPELSRGFRALKVWFTMKTHGLDLLSELMARNCAQARGLGSLIMQHPDLQPLAKVSLNIVCFRYRGPLANAASDEKLDRLNAKIVATLQLSGVAAPSTTRVGRTLAIRVALTNHRTQDQDLHVLVDETLSLGRSLGA
jgi:aromatic-L-amino-acid decarboxylase